MLNIISTGSNYIFMIMCAIYAVSCFTVFLPSTEDRQIKRMNRQERFMFIFHFICYGVLFLKTFDIKILILYVAQAVFFKVLILIYERIYADCSRILMNHTCFLLLIGFVVLTRRPAVCDCCGQLSCGAHRSVFSGKGILAEASSMDIRVDRAGAARLCFCDRNN